MSAGRDRGECRSSDMHRQLCDETPLQDPKDPPPLRSPGRETRSCYALDDRRIRIPCRRALQTRALSVINYCSWEYYFVEQRIRTPWIFMDERATHAVRWPRYR